MSRSRIAVFIAAALIVVAGCGATAPVSPAVVSAVPVTPPATSPAGSGPSSGTPSGPPSADPSHPDTVRLALDWTPNTDHTGFYVAQAKGLYRAAAIDLKILPYGSIAPETLMASGAADCGISFQDYLTFAVASGVKIKSVMAIIQHDASAIAVLASSGITRPKQLDGKTYAGFGGPSEEPMLKAIIKADGGKGDFKFVTLDSAAYEALYNKTADFTIPFTAWEGVEAKERGIDLRYFQFSDYGFPDFYQVVLACSDDFLNAHPDVARRFVGATAQGFQYAATNPDDAAAILIAQNPGVFDANTKLPLDSARFLAQGGYYLDSSGAVGHQTLQEWTGFSRFLFDEGLLAGPDGNPLTTPPDYASLFTNDFLP